MDTFPSLYPGSYQPSGSQNVSYMYPRPTLHHFFNLGDSYKNNMDGNHTVDIYAPVIQIISIGDNLHHYYTN
jgi:hypothetical protein